jgi:hypothetical protein
MAQCGIHGIILTSKKEWVVGTQHKMDEGV